MPNYRKERLPVCRLLNITFNKLKKQKHLNAFIEVYADEALAESKGTRRKKKNTANPLKQLHGVVIGIKRCYLLTKITDYLHHQIFLKILLLLYSATAVEKLLAEDAIIIGRTNCDEFAMGSTNENSAYGKVLNAMDETRTPGGSSGGSAVAVQADLCMVSLGSDTGGSVRQPADFCGIVGLKPTYGRISRYGLIAYASSFDQIGIFGNNIPDISKVLEVISGSDEYDSTVSQKNVESYSHFFKKRKNIVSLIFRSH